MGKPRVRPKTVQIPDRILIAGKWWKLKPYTKAVKDEIAKYSPGVHKSVGSTLAGLKRIYYAPRQHEEELLDTLMHEGLHAILYERSENPLWAAMCQDEDSVALLTAEIMNYLKQVGDVTLKKKGR